MLAVEQSQRVERSRQSHVADILPDVIFLPQKYQSWWETVEPLAPPLPNTTNLGTFQAVVLDGVLARDRLEIAVERHHLPLDNGNGKF